MKKFPLRFVWVLAVATITATSLPIFAQQASAYAQQSASASAGGVGASESANSSSSADLRPVSGELESKLDSKTAKVGDAVIVKTRSAVKTADGTVIPKGARLVGHVTDVQAHGSGNADSRIGLAFDRAEWKNGGSVAIHSVIEAVQPPVNLAAQDSGDVDGGIAAPMGGGRAGGGGAVGVRGGGLVGGTVGGVTRTTAGVTSGLGSTSSSTIDATGHLAAGATSTVGSTVHETAGASGSVIAHATGVPGVALSNEASAASSGNVSGTLFGSRRNVHLDSGTRMTMALATSH